MRGVNDRKFLIRWQMLHQATCPNPTATGWRVGDVEWRKQRLNLAGGDFTLSLDVHRLSRNPARAGGWVLLVVVEHWWDGGQAVIKSANWARVLEGNAKAVLAWMRERDGARPES